MQPLIDLVVQRLLAERGSRRMYRRTLIVPDDPAASYKLASIDHALRAAALALTDDLAEADTEALHEELASLKKARLAARSRVGATAVERLVYVGTVAQVWDLCADDEQRHDILGGQIEALVLTTSARRTRFRADRARLSWRDEPKPIVPEAISVGPIHQRMGEPHPWISYRAAARLLGSNETLIRRGIKSGEIRRRQVHSGQPSLERASVTAFVRDHGSGA